MAEPLAHPESPAAPLFAERPTGRIVRDAWPLAAVPAGLALLASGLGAGLTAAGLAALAVFVLAFFRNPPREIPGDEHTAVAPADGRVVAVGEVEDPDGKKALRIGIFLSIFNVHVNRCPLAGRVVAVERGGDAYLAAFDARAEHRNVRCALTLETAEAVRFRVVQITGLVARRIVCHPQVGEWVRRGARYGLIRFGSRTDLVLPPDARALVAVGERVRGGSTPLAVLAPRSAS